MAGRGRTGALELLLRLTRINDGGRHTRQRISRQEALIATGNGKAEIGERILRRLSGERAEEALAGAHGGLRLVVVTIEQDAEGEPLRDADGGLIGHVDLIHETLIRARGKDEQSGKPIGYWPSLYAYIEANRDRDLHRQQLAIEARRWSDSRLFGRWWNLAALGDYLRYRRLRVDPKSLERRFLKSSLAALIGQAALGVFVIGVIGVIGESAWWATENSLPSSYVLRKPLWWLGVAAPLPEMVMIEPGGFTMGCKPGRDDVEGVRCKPDEAQPVTVGKPYSLGKYEVTFLQYDYYVWDQKRKGKGDHLIYPPDEKRWGREDRPVINVSWSDAVAYLEWLTKREKLDAKWELYRLPTEVEWEYAARGGRDTPFGWAGKAFDKSKANCPPSDQTLPVTRIDGWANGFGLHDMIGNVWEWTVDVYRVDTGRRQRESRMLRGGSWISGPVGCRAADRFDLAPGGRGSFIGFRVCRGSPIEPPGAAPLDTETLQR
jgi:formylglycine-generating enzyme required for sulfatase activity